MQSLSEYGEWNKPTEQSWKWMWDIVNNKFVMHMESAARVVGLIERSWKYIEDNYDLEDISDIFFKYFFHKAPGLQAYFVKPTKMQRVMLEKALNLIVNSVRDTAVLNIELKGIAMQHIKYDITADHLKIFGDVLLSLLRDTAGEDHWDNEARALCLSCRPASRFAYRCSESFRWTRPGEKFTGTSRRFSTTSSPPGRTWCPAPLPRGIRKRCAGPSTPLAAGRECLRPSRSKRTTASYRPSYGRCR